jgi:hypothetical protein
MEIDGGAAVHGRSVIQARKQARAMLPSIPPAIMQELLTRSNATDRFFGAMRRKPSAVPKNTLERSTDGFL